MNAPNYHGRFVFDVVPADKTSSRPWVQNNYGNLINKIKSPDVNDALFKKLVKAALRIRFEKKLKVWISETASLSSPSEIARHPLWSDILDFREEGTEFAINILKRGRRYVHLFLILNQINGFNAFGEEGAGKPDEMADGWIRWWDDLNKAA